jgi:hypothetical protein
MKHQKTVIGTLFLFAGLCFGTTLARAQVTPNHDHFDNRDRQVASDWYKSHPEGFKNEEGADWHAAWEPNLHSGFVLTSDMRAAIHRVPAALETQFGPAPDGYRFVVIGDHVLLIDNDFRIHDVLHLEIDSKPRVE